MHSVKPLPDPIATTIPAAEASSAAESDDLDALLASLDDSSGADSAGGSGMDAELAALLADL